MKKKRTLAQKVTPPRPTKAGSRAAETRTHTLRHSHHGSKESAVRNDEIIAVRGREQCGVSIAGIAGVATATKARAGVRDERRRRRRRQRRRVVQASRFPCSIPVERSQCRVTMAGMDHLFLLLGLSQSLLKIERAPGGNVPFRRKIRFSPASLARVQRSSPKNPDWYFAARGRACALRLYRDRERRVSRDVR